MYRFLRCFLCLLVVCCLIINLSPIKADATAAGAAIAGAAGVTVSAPVVIAAGLIALGIMAGTNDDFQRVVGNAVDSLGDWVKDGTVELIQTVDTLGKKAYYVAADMMESLRLWCVDNTIYEEVSSLNTNVSVSFEGTNYVAEGLDGLSFQFACFRDTTFGDKEKCKYYLTAFSDSYGKVKINGKHYTLTWSERLGCYYSTTIASASSYLKGTFSASVPVYDYWVSNYDGYYPLTSIESDLDLSLGQVSSVPVDGTSARDWSEEYTNRGLYVDTGPDGDGNDEEGKWYWPIVLAGAGGAGVDTLTQADQWTTTTPDTFEEYETEEEYEVVGTPVVPFGSSVQLKPVTVPGVGDDTETDSGTTDDSADYTSWFDKIVGFLQNIWDSIKELPSKFASWFEAIIDGIQALPGKFATWFETIIDGIQAIPDVISGWFTDVIEWLTSIWEAICSIPTLILDGITAIFVPSEDFVTTKVEALRERFSWIEPILGYGDYIKAQLIDPEPPVLYVHLGNAEGSYNYGGTVKFLDLTWYERYKSQGDAIISGFLWALFAWRMYVKLPGIINGVAGDVGHISYGESAWQKTEGRKERKEKGGKNK